MLNFYIDFLNVKFYIDFLVRLNLVMRVIAKQIQSFLILSYWHLLVGKIPIPIPLHQASKHFGRCRVMVVV